MNSCVIGKLRGAGLLLAVAGTLLATYSYTVSYTFPDSTIDTTAWWVNGATGSVNGGAYGLVASGNGGAAVSKSFAASTGHEVKGKLNLAANGGTYDLLLRASTDAAAGPTSSGSFYAVEIYNPQLTSTSCSATLIIRKYFSGSWTNLTSDAVWCRPGMTVRAVILNTGQILVYFDNYFMQQTTAPVNDPSIPNGRAGAGGWGMPSGNGWAQLDLGALDTTAPSAVAANTVGASASSNYVDLQWRGADDDVNGIGVWRYYILRNSAIIGESSSAAYTDSSVSASTAYTYSIQACDYHKNCATATTIPTVTTAPTGAVDPVQVGVVPNGQYWGSQGEQINMRSGNLNFTVPVATAVARSGWSVTFALSYNSQLWRHDQGQTWKLGRDIGYGFGWRLQAGSLTPVYSSLWSLDHFLFIDSTGAEYRLNVNNNGIWTSKESIYVSYDQNSHRLYFRDGSFWVMGARSSGMEDDAGTLYPTVMQDTNGNQISIRYATGQGSAWINSSSRITEIEDARAVAFNGGNVTFLFNYDPPQTAGERVPHLSSVRNLTSTDFPIIMSYYHNQPLSDPWNVATQLDTTVFPYDITLSQNGYRKIHIDLSTTGELSKITFPSGGYIRWEYAAADFTSPSNPTGPARSVREVTNRYARYESSGSNERRHWLERDGGDTSQGRFVHYKMRLHDMGTVQAGGDEATKVWLFNYDPAQWNIGLPSQYIEKKQNSNPFTHYFDYTWVKDTDGNIYLGTSQETYNQWAPVARKTEQVLDTHGNLLTQKLYDWNSLTTPIRTYTNTYITNSSYTSLYIFNRLLTSTVYDGTNTLTLVSNTYDSYPGGPIAMPGARQHDDTYYGNGFATRGNLTSSTSFGVTTSRTYDVGGNVLTTTSTTGLNINAAPSSTTNYVVPTTMTTNGLNSSMAWNSTLQLTSVSGQNGDTSSGSYNLDGTPSSATSPYGATSSWAYDYFNRWRSITLNGRRIRQYLDGFGRVVKTDTLSANDLYFGSETLVSSVDTEYAPCGCSPLGKMKRVSQPYAPGGTKYWTTYTYDELGRTISVQAADGASTTTYDYGDTAGYVKVTDAAGKWKKMYMDALGNLTKVEEPDPVNTGQLHTTTYTYDSLNRLRVVTMPRPNTAFPGQTVTQTRTWTYDSSTQLLTSQTFPETGTTSFTYNTDRTLNYKIDANGNKVQFTYEATSLKRVLAVRFYASVSGAEDVCQRVDYTYDSDPSGFGTNLTGRRATATYHIGAATYSNCGDLVTETYGYTPAGALAKKRLALSRGTITRSLQAVYEFDNEGKVAAVTYPNGRRYRNTFDALQRLNGIQEDNYGSRGTVDWVNSVVYGPANELKQLHWNTSVDPSNGFYDVGPTETRTYNAMLQLTSLGGINYNYSATQNNGKIISTTNASTGATIQQYTYDAQNRLATTQNSQGTAWGLSFSYDGFGNRLNQTLTAGTAPSMSLTYDQTTNRILATGYSYDANGNLKTMPGSKTFSYDYANRMISAFISTSYEYYGYAPDNKRVWKRRPNGTEEMYFWMGNKQLAVLSPTMQIESGADTPTFHSFDVVGGYLYFGARKLTPQDRLGSDTSGGKSFYPYGEEVTSTSSDADKFATYYRDQTSGLDYADQRYYSSTVARFMTPDRYLASGASSDPKSWNRYAYVHNNPINFNDPRGTNLGFLTDESGGGGFWGGPESYPGEFGSFENFEVWVTGTGNTSGGGSGGGTGFLSRPVSIEEEKRRVSDWDLAIAAAAAAGRARQETNSVPYPAYLVLDTDCYSISGNPSFSGYKVERKRTYLLYDSTNQRMSGSFVLINEHLFALSGTAPNDKTPGTNGEFDDRLGIENRDPFQVLQTFTASVTNGSYDIPGFSGSIPLYVKYPNGSTYGTLNITATASYIDINGDRGTPCK
jgi:RHS repeat-associated protein